MTEILVNHDAGVCTITLNRVERKNSINVAMYTAMADALAAATADSTVRLRLIFDMTLSFRACRGSAG